VPPGADLCCGNVPCVKHGDTSCNCGVCQQLQCGAGTCCFREDKSPSCTAGPSACN
jgi:hypothetical protein